MDSGEALEGAGAQEDAGALDRARGCLLGLACGDALGAPAEFLHPERIRNRYGQLREMIGGGEFDWQPGETTDDTAMALILARSLVDHRSYRPDDVLERYIAWQRTSPKGIGDTVNGALEGVEQGMTTREATRLYHETHGGLSAGNGSLMRIAPIAIRYRNWPTDMAEHARTESALTHHDPLAAESCEFFCRLIGCYLRGEDPAEQIDVPDRLADASAADEEHCVRAAVRSSGFVLTSLAVACCAARTQPNPEEAIVWAVGLGFDADTNAAVTGALLGARDGASALPERWLQTLWGREELERLAADLFVQGAC